MYKNDIAIIRVNDSTTIELVTKTHNISTLHEYRQRIKANKDVICNGQKIRVNKPSDRIKVNRRSKKDYIAYFRGINDKDKQFTNL